MKKLRRLPFDAEVFKEVVNTIQPPPTPEIIERAQRWLTRDWNPPARAVSKNPGPRPPMQPFPSMQEIEKMEFVNAIVTKYLMAYAEKIIRERKGLSAS